MPKILDLTGKRFNMLTAIEIVGKSKGGSNIWKFQCDCGNYAELPACKVTSNTSTKSCGCLLKKPKIDMVGKKFGRLTVLEYAGVAGRRRTMWKCQCDCGNIVKVEGTHLRDGHTKSCGCLNKELIGNLNYKIGLSGTKLYYSYRNMVNRCTREDDGGFKDYGGRGIVVCQEWLGENGFVNFANWALSHGYKDELTIDRKDNDKGYSPDNCRWVDRYVQANNKRNNRFVKVNGEIGTVANMAKKYGVSYYNLMHYANGGQNCKYPELRIEVANESEIQEYRQKELSAKGA